MCDEDGVWDGDIFGGLWLVLTNLALVPSIVLLANRGDTTSALVLLLTFLASVIYHSCRSGFFCLAQCELHVMVDFLFVYVGTIWIITSLPFKILTNAADGQMHATLFFLFLGPIVVAIVSEVDFALLPLIGVVLPLIAVILYARVFASPKRKLFCKKSVAYLVTALLFILLAGICMFILQNSMYTIAHSLWHLFSMTGVFFVLLARTY
jgi:hypothetical protein